MKRYQLMEAEKEDFPIAFMARKLEVSRTGFYAWRRRPPSLRALEDASLGARAAAIHKEHKGRYGTPRVYRQLRAEGVRTSRKRVDRLLSEREVSDKLLQHTEPWKHLYGRRLPQKAQGLSRPFSMSRKGNCWDNAVSESFFGLCPSPLPAFAGVRPLAHTSRALEKELCFDTPFQSRDHARSEVFAYIEGYYNDKRIHSSINYLTPNQKEEAFHNAQALAA